MMADRAEIASTVRRHGTMVGFGLIGVLGLMTARVTQLLAAEVRLSSVWQPLILEVAVPTVAVVVAAIVGVWLNGVTGFQSTVYDWALDDDPGPPRREGLVAGSIAGTGVGLLAVGFDVVTGAFVGGLAMPSGLFGVAALGRIIYLSIAGEIVLRWGALSVLVYFAIGWFRVDGTEPNRRHVVVGAIVVLAATMALLQTMGTVEPTIEPLRAVGVGVLNFVPGVVFGAIFWRYSLETAMVAHATSHLPLFAVALLA
jgi:hypothetical protein